MSTPCPSSSTTYYPTYSTSYTPTYTPSPTYTTYTTPTTTPCPTNTTTYTTPTTTPCPTNSTTTYSTSTSTTYTTTTTTSCSSNLPTSTSSTTFTTVTTSCLTSSTSVSYTSITPIPSPVEWSQGSVGYRRRAMLAKRVQAEAKADAAKVQARSPQPDGSVGATITATPSTHPEAMSSPLPKLPAVTGEAVNSTEVPPISLPHDETENIPPASSW
ncbi:MAG: hypothetical protein M1838_004631 [Thelocarpon superellum]|nr:MAG: hypothetical protein M1838_004631 [Thelocarpon superellum]